MTNLNLKDYNLTDTIAAIATFPAKSALGVIKISGKRALDIISKIFLPGKKKDIKKVKTYTLHYGWIVDTLRATRCASHVRNDKLQGLIDEVLVSIMRKPFSYTKEDVVEISSHGGVFVLNKILEIILSNGGRLALPGEFTYRALINGRIDLLQAESISSIVDARSETALCGAVSQLRGGALEQFNKIKKELKKIFCETEAFINFPEDDVEFAFDVQEKLKCILKMISNLIKESEAGRVLKEGVKCVICGRTNVGKSTLFNRLLKEERVIVSEIAGTTRDVIEDTVNIGGLPLRIYDTAGVLCPRNSIEKKAIEKTNQIIQEADLIILVLDGSSELKRDDFSIIEKIKEIKKKHNKKVIVIINKADCLQKINAKYVPKFERIIKLSALKNKGLKRFEDVICKITHIDDINTQDIIFLNSYQREKLRNLKETIEKAVNFSKMGYTIDFVNFSLKEAQEFIDKLTGETFSEEILENIFSNFCIGK